MSLQDESFPADELFDKLNATAASNNRSYQRQFSVCLNLDEPDNFERDASPFLNSDCSEKTCASDPVGLEHDHQQVKHAINNNNNERDEDGVHHGHVATTSHLQLGSGRSSKAVSYQDIHSAYTKRRYKHVTSKVSKYIADIHDQEKQRRNSSSTFQRHRSMPESLTPRSGGADDQQKLDESLSLANSSGTDTHVRDESYDRLSSEKDCLQWHNVYLEAKLFKKCNDHIVLKRNFEAIRTELTECKDKLKRQTAGTSTIVGYSQRSPNLCPPVASECVTKATQTDLQLAVTMTHTAHTSHLSDLSDLPAIAANATPHPNCNLNDITYDSSAGSIEIPLLSVPPAPRQLQHLHHHLVTKSMKPLSLNFSNDSAEVDTNANASSGGGVGGNLQPTSSRDSSNRIATNNSGSSHPSSNDSAIEIEGHELRSPRLPYGQRLAVNFLPMRDWGQRECIIYFQKHSNRAVIEQLPLNSNANTSTSTSQFGVFQYTANGQMGQRKKSLGSRMLRLFGPCASCNDPNQTLDASHDATYTLLAHESNRSNNLR